jgi:hypothetical protein
MAVKAFGDPNVLHECENCDDVGWEVRPAGQFSQAWAVCLVCKNRRGRPPPSAGRNGIPIHIAPPGPGSV